MCVCVFVCCVLCVLVCGVLWCFVVVCCVLVCVELCVARLGKQKKPPCVDSKRLRVYQHHATVITEKILLFEDHNYVCTMLINSQKKRGMLCNLFVEHCTHILSCISRHFNFAARRS